MISKKIRIIIGALAVSAITMSGCGPKKDSIEKISTDEGITTEKNSTSESAGEGTAPDESVSEDAAAPAGAAGDVPADDGATGADISSKSLSKDSAKEEASDADTSTTDTEPIAPDTETAKEDEAKAGVLTAGRWNDNDNWGFFTNLVNNETITFPSYGIDPRNRFAVTVKNSDGKPLPNKTVTMLSEDGKDIWQSITDKDGTAYLFYQDSDKAASVEVTRDDGSTDSYRIKTTDKTSSGTDKGKSGNQNNNQASDSSLEIKIEESPVKYNKMDIMYIVDATGSMVDEMTFLQKDFSKIAGKASNDKTSFSVNFYRDEGDEYVTKCFDFTKDVEELQKNLNEQSADGGGDIPEAVHTILDESINKASWRNDSVKLAFLIFDAPPHSEENVITSLTSSIKKASGMGIHIIPVVSSNAERDTELFGRALAICTNGEYVFLTDDSGVGDSHLEPIIGDYKVQSLYDIIIDIIKEYTQK